MEDDYWTCHCGKAAIIHFKGTEEEYTRYLCRVCDAVRCDAYPGECRGLV